MSKPTIQEMVDFLDSLNIGVYWNRDDTEIIRAIRSTLLAVGEWKRQLDEPSYRTVLSPIEEQIRDFGEEGK